MDEPLWNVKEHDSIIEQIRNFKVYGYDVTETHKYVFPTQIAATRWKHDYIIFKKKRFIFRLRILKLDYCD